MPPSICLLATSHFQHSFPLARSRVLRSSFPHPSTLFFLLIYPPCSVFSTHSTHSPTSPHPSLPQCSASPPIRSTPPPSIPPPSCSTPPPPTPLHSLCTVAIVLVGIALSSATDTDFSPAGAGAAFFAAVGVSIQAVATKRAIATGASDVFLWVNVRVFYHWYTTPRLAHCYFLLFPHTIHGVFLIKPHKHART